MKDLSAFTDEELIKFFRGGDNKAVEELFSRYKNKVLSVARRFFLASGDTEDLVQEGMCGLYGAVVSFSGDSGFSAYAQACVRNRIIDAVRRSSKRRLSTSGELAFTDGGDELAAEEISPEEKLIGSENTDEFANKIKTALSPLEYRAIAMYIDGATMNEISTALNKTYKQIDNALVRAKHKLQKIF